MAEPLDPDDERGAPVDVGLFLKDCGGANVVWVRSFF